MRRNVTPRLSIGFRSGIAALTSLIIAVFAALATLMPVVAYADESVVGTRCWVKPVQPENDLMKTLIGNVIAPKTLLGVSFRNAGDQVLTDIKVHYEFTDAFGATVDALDGVWSGSFAPGVVINFMPPQTRGILQERPLLNADHVKGVNCTITGARWADGTVLSYPVKMASTASDSSDYTVNGLQAAPPSADSSLPGINTAPATPSPGICELSYASYHSRKALLESRAKEWESALADVEQVIDAYKPCASVLGALDLAKANLTVAQSLYIEGVFLARLSRWSEAATKLQDAYAHTQQAQSDPNNDANVSAQLQLNLSRIRQWQKEVARHAPD